MAFDPYIPTFPGQAGGVGATNALHTSQITGIVEGTLKKRSAVFEHLPLRDVKGTSSFKSYAQGAATMQTVTPGVAPNSTASESAQRVFIIDRHNLCRNTVPKLDFEQQPYDSLAAIGEEHGITVADFYDTAALIQGVRAGLATSTSYTPLTAASGFKGGSQVTLAAAGDRTDSAKLYSKLTDMLTAMALKRVNLLMDNIVVYVNPSDYNTLLQSQFLINSQYITATGNTVMGTMLKLLGVPVMSTIGLPQSVITGHLLHNAVNGNVYDGDYSKVVALAMGKRAIEAGSSIPVTSRVWYSDSRIAHVVDTEVAIGFGPNRNEFAGVLLAP